MKQAYFSGLADTEPARPRVKLVTLSDGSILVNDRDQYMRHRNRVYLVGERGALVPAFDALEVLPAEPFELAVRRGLAGARGPLARQMRVARASIIVAVVLYAVFWIARHG